MGLLVASWAPRLWLALTAKAPPLKSQSSRGGRINPRFGSSSLRRFPSRLRSLRRDLNSRLVAVRQSQDDVAVALAPRNDAIPSPFLGYGDHESLSSLQQIVSTDWVESTDVWPSPPIRCCRLDASKNLAICGDF
jgi:hypothetical protein